MKKALIIDHGSSLMGELLTSVGDRGYDGVLKNYKNLGKADVGQYHAVISGGGNSKIAGNPDLEDELRIWDECEVRDIPMMGICHGAQIGAHNSGGKYSKLNSARKGIFDDYKIEKDDPLLKGVENLTALEWHDYNIGSVGESYEVLMTDSKGNIQIGRHKDSRIYLVEFHPEANRPKDNPVTNGGKIINNFLEMK